MTVVFGDNDALNKKLWRNKLRYDARQGRAAIPGWFLNFTRDRPLTRQYVMGLLMDIDTALRVKIEESDLPMRVVGVLERFMQKHESNRLRTLAGLADADGRGALERIPGIGPKSLEQIRVVIGKAVDAAAKSP